MRYGKAVIILSRFCFITLHRLTAPNIFADKAKIKVEHNRKILNDESTINYKKGLCMLYTAMHNWSKYILNSFDVPYSNSVTEG